MTSSPSSAGARSPLQLQYPMSLGVHDDYTQAQRVVDHLSDHQFPVQNCLIVGTDLKQVERVTGRLTWGRVLLGGALSGAWMGLFVGLIFTLFGADGSGVLPILASTMLFGALFGLLFSAAGYALSRGRRDFTSVSQVVATRYEVLVEHSLAQQARDLIDRMDAPAAAARQPGQ